MSTWTIWKFELLVTDHAEVEMPHGATLLDVQATSSPAFLQLWAVIDPTAPKEPRRFEIRGTGHPLGKVGPHIATVQTRGLVWHVFEEASR